MAQCFTSGSFLVFKYSPKGHLQLF